MKINFILAEEFRPEINGKVTALGIYSTNNILLNRTPDDQESSRKERLSKLPIGLDRLSFLISVCQKIGKFENYIQIINPNGEVVLESNKPEFTLTKENKNSGHIFMIQAAPFPITKIGKYICRYYLNNKPYDFDFFIDLNEQKIANEK